MAKKLIAVGVDVRTKSLSRAEDSAVVLEDGNSPVETGTIFIRIFGHHDAITFTCLFMVATLSIQAAMSRDILPVIGQQKSKKNHENKVTLSVVDFGSRMD